MIKIYVNGENTREIRFEQQIPSGENQTVYYFKYNNEIKFAYDLEQLVLSGGNIYSKAQSGDITVLKRDDGATIELRNFDNPTLKRMLDKKLLESFVSLFNRMKSEEVYKYVYLTTHPSRSGIELIHNSSNDTARASMVCEIEVDDGNELTTLGKQTLDFILNKEFREWLNVFLTGEQDRKFKVCYDDKVMIVSNDLVDYVKPEAKKMEEVYLTTLEKLNTEKR